MLWTAKFQMAKCQNLRFYSLQCNTPDIKSGRFPWLPFPGSFCLHCKPNTTHFSLQTPNHPPLASMTNWPNTRCLQGRGGARKTQWKDVWMGFLCSRVYEWGKSCTVSRWWLSKEGVYKDVKWMWEVFGRHGSRHLGLGKLLYPIILIQRAKCSLVFIFILNHKVFK